MTNKKQPRFFEEQRKLRQAVLRYGDNTKLARESGVGRATIDRITDGLTRFPWFQTVHALRLVLDRQFKLPTEAHAPVIKTQAVRARRTRKLSKEKPARHFIRQSTRRLHKLV